MENKPKTRIAFFDFADCEGCQLQLTYLDETFLDILKYCQIVNFREAFSERSDEYDIAVVEGSIHRAHDEERVRKIRENAKILIAYGACATTGGVNGLRLRYSQEEAKRIVYPDRQYPLDAGEPRAVDQVVKVDYYVYGCPTHNSEFIKVLRNILMGTDYINPNYAVCVECKLKENVCLFEKDQVCMGPVTRAGCGAWCTSYGNTCYGCRGLLPEWNLQGQMDVLRNYGYSPESLLQKFTLYNLCKQGDQPWAQKKI